MPHKYIKCIQKNYTTILQPKILSQLTNDTKSDSDLLISKHVMDAERYRGSDQHFLQVCSSLDTKSAMSRVIVLHKK
jgi:hypothetical protein